MKTEMHLHVDGRSIVEAIRRLQRQLKTPPPADLHDHHALEEWLAS